MDMFELRFFCFQLNGCKRVVLVSWIELLVWWRGGSWESAGQKLPFGGKKGAPHGLEVVVFQICYASVWIFIYIMDTIYLGCASLCMKMVFIQCTFLVH